MFTTVKIVVLSNVTTNYDDYDKCKKASKKI